MKRPWRPLSDFSFCGRSTCCLEPWKYGNSISLDAPVCCRSIDEFIAFTVVSVNKSIGANLGVQMVKTSLHIWLWQMGFVIDLTLRWTTEEKYTGGSFGHEKRRYYGLLLSRQLLEDRAGNTSDPPDSSQHYPALHVSARYLSPTILSLPFVSLTAGATVTPWVGPQTGGGHIATDVNKRIHLFTATAPFS